MKKAGIVVAAAVLLVGGFILLQPKAADPVPEPTAQPATIPTGEPTVAATFAFADGAMDGPTTVDAGIGDQVQITLTADESGMLHLHGYEIIVDVEPGAPATLDVLADQAGRFSLEFHGDPGTQAQVTELEVTP